MIFIYRCLNCGQRAELTRSQTWSLGSWKCRTHGSCKVKRELKKEEQAAE